MLRINKQGFTLIELMVVIVIIGVLASLAIPRFTEASAKAKMGEAPRIIASYESGYLATQAELGAVASSGQLIVAIPATSKWFAYTLANDAATLSAVAQNKIGVFSSGSSLISAYQAASDCFVHTADAGADKLIPNFQTGPVGCP